MGSRVALVLLVLCVVTLTARANTPVTYSVGGESGWTLGAHISMLPHLHPGDTVHFSYSAEQHNVYMVSESDYYSCKSSSPWAVHNSGNDYITLSNSGTYYFICSVGGHCADGMKLAVTVD